MHRDECPVRGGRLPRRARPRGSGLRRRRDGTVAAGVREAESAAAAVEDAALVVLSLPGPDDVETVVDRIESVLKPSSVLVDTTTSRLPG
jgi:3-hydroxyisobutyrate dehydrogenase-like beta-hydroxyacid dehydrogenase